MSNKEYKKYIIEMLDKIDDNEHLKRIFNYVHKYFIKKAGKWSLLFLIENTLQVFFNNFPVFVRKF